MWWMVCSFLFFQPTKGKIFSLLCLCFRICSMCSTLSSQRFIFSHLFNVLNNCDYTFSPELSFRQMSTIERNVYFPLFAQDISTLWPLSNASIDCEDLWQTLKRGSGVCPIWMDGWMDLLAGIVFPRL